MSSIDREPKPRSRVSLTGLHRRVGVLERKSKMTDTRLERLENAFMAIESIPETLGKIKRILKLYGPGVVAAAVAAGLVDGRVGAFLRALLGG